MPIAGTQQVTAQIAPTALTDVYPTHTEEYGKGGYQTVADITARDAITTERRKEGMKVNVLSNGLEYTLDNDLTTWNQVTTGAVPADVMLKSVYDPGDDGVVNDSDRLNGQLDTFYLALANMTGTLPQANVTSLVADLALKIDLSEKGANNGVATLDGAGLIPPAQIPITGLVYKGVWDANTNTPALASGVGTLNDFYWINVAGTTSIDGIASWAVGDAIVYNGTVWQKGIIATGVTTVNTQTGAVVLDADDVAETATNKYVTSVQADGLDNTPIPPSTTNFFVTKQYLEAQGIVVGAGWHTIDKYADGQTLGDGTARTLTSLGYTNGSAGAIWTDVDSAYTMDVTTMTIDWIAGQEALLRMASEGWHSLVDYGNKTYMLNQSWDLPEDQTQQSSTRASLMFLYDFSGSRINNGAGTDFPLINKMPVNQAQANGLQLDYAHVIKNVLLRGVAGASNADCGINLGGSNKSRLERVYFENFHTAANWIFALNSTMNDIRITNCTDDGLVIATGVGFWSGATVNNSQSNNVGIDECRVYFGTSTDMRSGIYIGGSRNITIDNSQFEGANGAKRHIYYSSEGSTTVRNLLSIRNIDLEAASASIASIRVESNSGEVDIDGLFCQQSAAAIPILISVGAYSTGSPLYITLRRNSYVNGWKFLQDWQHKWDVANWNLNDNSKFNSASNFDDATGVLPLNGFFDYRPKL